MIHKHANKVRVDIETSITGPSHGPLFTTQVTLQSKEYANDIMQLQGFARKKKEAEVQAFHRPICLLVS